ncbi:MAG: ROK family protein, partial [Lachnospiraceae bacterium]|nr:ROK family protein [Lachnospiraceae bacterium]
MRYLAGIDIGGTKCAVTLGEERPAAASAETSEEQIRILDKIKFSTPAQPDQAVRQMTDALAELLERHPEAALEAVGVSCGGPLDSGRGLILSPPNLPGWDGIDVLSPFRERFHVPAALQNDANACALAEWRWGAGRGTQNMIFLTFGTGLGAGLI